ncbi:hypothetical protein [Clostridium beijerinckii]|uniref:hypothetical protein n=1 Tax=Clostridium beijerinckii TaxID=1520 RepID=UPI0022DEF476|nr:hypothetical protein [Clostridium beijerinckii]
MAFKRKDPMHFWSGSTVRPEEIADITSYNRANGLMWASYAFCMFMTGILSLFSTITGVILLIIICVPGIVVLAIAYNRIYNKYRSTSVIYKADESTSKTPKVVIIAITSISAIILIGVVALFSYGEKEPDVSILDNRIQIKAMYGLNIDFSEVHNISLIEKSMSDIGIGTRTNGYGGIGETLKGNFKSDTLGETLLFVQSKSSPTIKIERTGKKDVYISLHNSESTEHLYRELIENIPLK